MPGNAILVNFAGGETSPKSRGRFDIASYNSSCRKLVNFIAEVSGPARYRPGFKFLAETRGGLKARLIPFQRNNEQAYMLEFTSGAMRSFQDGVYATAGAYTDTYLIQYSFGETWLNGPDLFAEGDYVRIEGFSNTKYNGQIFRIAILAGPVAPRRLVDPITGADVMVPDPGTSCSGGTVRKIAETATPYLEEDLDDIQYVQTIDAMYLTHWKYAPRKLTLNTATGVWTLAVVTRTNDPFTTGAVLNVTGVNRTAKGSVVLSAAPTAGVSYTFASVGGTTQLNSGVYKLEQAYTKEYISDPPFYVKRYIPSTYWLVVPATGAYVDTSGWTAYTTGGTATPETEAPLSVAFYENRLVHGGTNRRPRTLFLSMAPDSNGASRFDTFTGGTSADNACFFSLAPVGGSVDYVVWLGGTSRYLLTGTFGGVFRVSGGGLEEPITPSSINVKQLDTIGCAPHMPVLIGDQLYFIERGGRTVRRVKYTADADDFATEDICRNADQVGYSPIFRLAYQTGNPGILWALRADGVLSGVTIDRGEQVTGWHRHKIGGANAKIIDVAVLPRPGSVDQVYVITERTIDGGTHRSVEVMADDVVYPDPEDFYTAESAQASNEEAYMDAVYRLQERYIHIDASATYNGASAGISAEATLTPSAATVGTGRTFTASADVFTEADVGKEIWKKPSAVDGSGAGRATITAYVSATEVTCDIDSAFDSTSAIPAGDWYLAADEISGLWHLEGERVAVVADGAVYSDGKTADYPVVTVTNGTITLTRNCAVVHVGLPYEGMLITHNLEMGGSTGPAQDKPRNIARMAIRFLNSLGCEFGTSLYRTEKVVHNSNKYVSDRPTPVFSGIKIVHNSDTWKPDSGDKNIVVVQKLPLPCVVQFIDVHYETGDEA